jgi:hypothetical protein
MFLPTIFEVPMTAAPITFTTKVQEKLKYAFKPLFEKEKHEVKI